MAEALKARASLRYSKEVNLEAKHPYLPSDELVEAVNLAIMLKRPLLLKGEPGSGKTCLARAVAEQLGLGDPKEWHVKSTGRARDGLYTFDNVGRLRDAQLANSQHLSLEQREEVIARLNTPRHYVKMGPLGKALASKQTTVVLIDEIDKADIDFPNDLLRELDMLEFTIDETDNDKTIKATPGAEPIIFITSNDEKELPDAFLRRCLFYYIEFPHNQLEEIVQLHFPHSTAELRQKVVARFRALRLKMDERGQVSKKVSTSELIDWFTILDQEENQTRALALADGKLPASILFKHQEDYNHFRHE